MVSMMDILNAERLKSEKVKIDHLFGNRVEIIPFDGGHEMKPEIIQNLI